MIFIFGGLRYKEKKITLRELNRSMFLLHWNTNLIFKSELVAEYMLNGMIVDSPRGNDLNYLLQYVIIRCNDSVSPNGEKLNPLNLTIDSKVSFYFPWINLFQKVNGLKADQIGPYSKVYANVNDSDYFIPMAKSMNLALTDLANLSLNIKGAKSTQIFDYLVKQCAAKNGVTENYIRGFYECVRDVKLLVSINANILELTKGNILGSFQKAQLKSFKSRTKILKERWDSTLVVLDKYSELVQNKEFRSTEAWLSLLKRLSEFGLVVE